MMEKINVNEHLRSDARIRPSDAGRDFAKDLRHKLGWNGEEIELNCWSVDARILISAFFINFWEQMHQEGEGWVKAAFQKIKWTFQHKFQASNVERWAEPYEEKLFGVDSGEETPVEPELVSRLLTWEHEGKEIMSQLRRCELWKAIQKSIEKETIGESCMMDKTGDLIHHRGTGAFSLKKVYAHPPGAMDLPYPAVRFVFDVSCWHDEWEQEVDASVMIDLPAELVDNFDQKKFDEWYDDRRKEHRKTELKRAQEQLAAFYEKWPELKGES